MGFLRRLLPVPIVLLGTSVLVFALPRLSGADVPRAVLRARVASATPDPVVEARVAAEFGLHGTATEQYLRWLGAAVRGDFGLSYVTRSPVVTQVADALAVSGLLTVLALVLAALLGVPAGLYAANRPGGFLDRIVLGAGVLGASVPEFVLAPLLVLGAAVGLGVLPAVGWGGPEHLVLPVLTLAAYPASLAAQLIRSEAVTALRDTPVRLARAKGLSGFRVLWRHGARLSTTSVLSLAGMFVAGLLGGSVVVEVVFGIPGTGRMLYDAVLAQDLPVIQAGVLAVVAVALLAGVLVDALHRLLDPRIR